MFLNFLLCYIMRLTEKNHQQMMKMSYKVPIFIFCYSPYCGHCKQIHPSWNKLSDKLENDPGIIIGEMDCNSVHSICSSIHRVNGYPTFTVVIKGISKHTDVGRDYESLFRKANELKNLNLDTLCNQFPAQNPSYPALVFSVKGKLSEGCTLIDAVGDRDEKLISQLYARPNSTEMKMSVYYSSTTYFDMPEPLTIDNAKAFAKEYRTANFDTIKWGEVFSRKRAVVLLIISNSKDIVSFRPIATQNSEDFYWNSVMYNKYLELTGDIELKEEDLPAALITSKKKNKYTVVSNVTSENIEIYLKRNVKDIGRYHKGNLRLMFHDIKLFPGFSSTTRIVLIIFAVVICVAVLVCAFYYSLDRTVKFE